MTRRTFLAGATVVLPSRVASGLTVVVEDGRVAELVSGPREIGAGEERVDLTGRVIVPGFIDVHVHGVAGIDVLDGRGAVTRVARRLPEWGVTAFCPTSLACPPDVLSTFLQDVADARAAAAPGHARVLPAHLESNFISHEFRGAQPSQCLRTPAPVDGSRAEGFDAGEILALFERHRPDIGIVTLAPELPGGLDLVRGLVRAGTRVALGHSGASFDEAQAAIAAGASHATHLFNRMRPMSHRDPGLVGAVLSSDEIAAEIIADGCHVHPAVMRVAIAAKGPSRLMAISDGTAGAGLPAGSRTQLGGLPITVGDVARLDDGTMAGSVATMDRVFATLVTACDLDLVQAAEMCATTPARELGLIGFGLISPGAAADFAVLDDRLAVVETWIAGVRTKGPLEFSTDLA
jgi:N-acetylglucosamine-6-phosphate deacetylase